MIKNTKVLLLHKVKGHLIRVATAQKEKIVKDTKYPKLCTHDNLC